MKMLFRLIGKLINEIVSYFEQGNRTYRELQQIDSKATNLYRNIKGYPFNDSDRLTNAQLEEVFLPKSKSVDEAWDKLCSLGKDELYSLLLILIWANKYEKPVSLDGFPKIK